MITQATKFSGIQVGMRLPGPLKLTGRNYDFILEGYFRLNYPQAKLYLNGQSTEEGWGVVIEVFHKKFHAVALVGERWYLCVYKRGD